jgi:hypothetical protein
MTPLAVLPDYQVSLPDAQPLPPPRRGACAAPGCLRSARHRHHIVNRKKTGGPIDWIIVTIEGQRWLVQNVVDLCCECHDSLESQVGGTKYRIRFLMNAGWAWYRLGNEEDTELTRIWWFDDKTKTGWVFRGFLRGDGWVTSLK